MFSRRTKDLKDPEHGHVDFRDARDIPRPLKRQGTVLVDDFRDQQSLNDTERLEFQLSNLREQIDAKRIKESLKSHTEFEVRKGYRMRNLPKFDDLTPYGVSSKQETELWELEVDRLVEAAQSEEPPILEGDSEWYGLPNSDGYNLLHQLVRQLNYAIDICIHDNQIILLENEPDLADASAFQLVHVRIGQIFDENEGSVRYEGRISIGEHNDKVYHAFVNFFTAVMIRLLSRSMHGSFWIDNCVSVLARFSAKFKVLGANLPLAFERTLEGYREFKARVMQPAAHRDIYTLQSGQPGPEPGGEKSQKQQKAMQEDMIAPGGHYFLRMHMVRDPMVDLLRIATADLMSNDNYGRIADIFDTSSIVYDTGFPSQRAHLYQDRENSIGVTSGSSLIDLAVLTLQSAMEIWDELPNSDDIIDKDYTRVQWTSKNYPYQPKPEVPEPEASAQNQWSHTVNLISMKDTISAVVPYFMHCSGCSGRIMVLAKVVRLLSDSLNPVKSYDQKKIVAAARLTTSSTIDAKRRAPQTSPYSKSVHETDMARTIQNERSHEGLQRELEKVVQWTFDEKSITIKHEWYSIISLLVCSLLIGGGLAFMALENQVQGVDPSNLTTLSWAAAGFVMVYFKSRRVQDWPWRDFLRGRIVCRSITEVESVTRMDPQKLMAILLRFEGRLRLTTRGPYNALFERKADDGFSIDVPQMNSTVIAGGHIFVEVDGSSGPALVALSATGDWLDKHSSLGFLDVCRKGERFICMDFVNQWKIPLKRLHEHGEEVDSQLPLYPITEDYFSWNGIRGVFSEEACFD